MTMTEHSNEEKYRLLTERTQGDYQAFLYDCDGTLANNMMAHKSAYAKVAAVNGLELDTSLIDELAGWPTVMVVSEINSRYGTSFDPVTFATEKSRLFIEEYIEQTQPVSYVVDHLKAHSGKIKIGVVSGGSRKTVTKTLQVLGIYNLVEALVCTGETPRSKPFPDPFLYAAELLNVDPAKCMVFEDGEPGVQAAISAGMDWVRVDKI